MDLSDLFTNAIKTVKSNAPEIFTALGVAGVVSTAVLTAKATLAAEKKLDMYVYPKETDRKMQIEQFKDKARIVWKDYVPPVVCGAATIACIIASHKSGSRRTAAAVAAYSFTEKAFSEYKEKAAKQIGENKERAIRDEIAQDHVNGNPPTNREVTVVGRGNVLFYDLRSCRYLRTTKPEMEKAMNQINWQINHERYVSLSEFYILIGLEVTRESVYVGWTLDKGLMELDFAAVITEEDEPCITFTYNYCSPIHDEDMVSMESPCDW